MDETEQAECNNKEKLPKDDEESDEFHENYNKRRIGGAENEQHVGVGSFVSSKKFNATRQTYLPKVSFKLKKSTIRKPMHQHEI